MRHMSARIQDLGLLACPICLSHLWISRKSAFIQQLKTRRWLSSEGLDLGTITAELSRLTRLVAIKALGLFAGTNREREVSNLLFRGTSEHEIAHRTSYLMDKVLSECNLSCRSNSRRSVVCGAQKGARFEPILFVLSNRMLGNSRLKGL
jgi:hypothetical protein